MYVCMYGMPLCGAAGAGAPLWIIERQCGSWQVLIIFVLLLYEQALVSL